MASKVRDGDDAPAEPTPTAENDVGERSAGEDERVEEANEDSFPASDAPAWSTPAPVDRPAEDADERKD